MSFVRTGTLILDAVDSLEGVSTAKSEGNSEERSIPQKVFLEWIKDELASEAACLQLPFTIIQVISFMILANLHQQNYKIFAVEEAIEFDIEENANFAFSGFFGHKGIHDVNSIADFWSWARLGFLPVMMTSLGGHAYSEGLGSHDSMYNVSNLATEISYSTYDGNSVPIPGDYLHFNIILGGIRFRQEVTKMSKEYCVSPRSINRDRFNAWYKKPCSQFSPRPHNLPPELNHAESYGRGEHSREEWLKLDANYPLEMKLIDMEDGCQNMITKGRACLCNWCRAQSQPRPWVDEHTERVEISIVLYNPVYGLYVLCGVNFFINRAGHIDKLIHVQSSWADPLHLDDLGNTALMFAMDAVWILSLIYIALTEVADVLSVIRKHGLKGIWNEYLSFWNSVDWVSIVCAAIMVTNFFELLDVGSRVDEAFEALMEKGTTDSRIQKVYTEVEYLVRFERQFRLWFVVYPGIIMLRLFKAFAAQPRLAVVTDTLVFAWQDILHFCIVFVSIFISFTMSGNLLFGQDIEGFATLDRAFFTCFRCMLGDFDWEEFEQVGRAAAGLWFGLFMVIVNILLLNMSMAIVMSAYDEVRLRAGNAQTLMQQMQEIQRKFYQKHRGARVCLAEVVKAFIQQEPNEDKRMNDETLLTKQMLMDIVLKQRGKAMPEHQAGLVLEKAEKWYLKRALLEEKVDDKSAQQMAADVSAMDVSAQLAQLLETQQYLVSEVQSLRGQLEQRENGEGRPTRTLADGRWSSHLSQVHEHEPCSKTPYTSVRTHKDGHCQGIDAVAAKHVSVNFTN